MEINFVDPMARTGYRFRGDARIIEGNSSEFATLRPSFDAWGELADTINCIGALRVTRALALSSPAYDMGQTEADLRKTWMAHFTALQPDDGGI
jgi:hypothetical protein